MAFKSVGTKNRLILSIHIKKTTKLVFLNVIIYIILFYFILYCMLCPKFRLLCFVVDYHFISPTSFFTIVMRLLNINKKKLYINQTKVSTLPMWDFDIMLEFTLLKGRCSTKPNPKKVMCLLTIRFYTWNVYLSQTRK